VTLPRRVKAAGGRRGPRTDERGYENGKRIVGVTKRVDRTPKRGGGEAVEGRGSGSWLGQFRKGGGSGNPSNRWFLWAALETGEAREIAPPSVEGRNPRTERQKRSGSGRPPNYALSGRLEKSEAGRGKTKIKPLDPGTA